MKLTPCTHIRPTCKWQRIFVAVSLFICARATFEPNEVPLFGGIANLHSIQYIHFCAICVLFGNMKYVFIHCIQLFVSF